MTPSQLHLCLGLPIYCSTANRLMLAGLVFKNHSKANAANLLSADPQAKHNFNCSTANIYLN